MHPARLLATALCFLLFSSAASAHSDAAPTQLFDEVTERARELAASPYEPLDEPLPQALQEIGYDRSEERRVGKEGRGGRAVGRGKKSESTSRQERSLE